MFPYDPFRGMDNGAGIPLAGLAWMMFAQSGEPGYYMLYNDLTNPPVSGDELLE